MNEFPFFKQTREKDCGPACLKMICEFYDLDHSFTYLKNLCNFSTEGTSLFNLQQAAVKLNFKSYGIRTDFEQLFNDNEFPCILHWNESHYVVLVPGSTKDDIIIADPASGIFHTTKKQFDHYWVKENGQGYALIIVPTERTKKSKSFDWLALSYFLQYFRPHKRKLILLLLLFMISGAISYVIPHITRDVIDKAVNNKSINILLLFLLAQFALTTGSLIIEIVRSWMVLSINNNFTLHIVQRFLSKVLMLPIVFFDNKNVGDIQQRISDNSRIQSFIVSNSSTLIVTTVTFIALFVSLAGFSAYILVVLLVFGFMKSFWVKYFLRRRKELDYAQFNTQSINQDNLFEILSGAQDIKLHNCENEKIDNWKKTQLNILDLSKEGFRIGQRQSIGSTLINNIENILITYISASAVINNEMTLGTMMSINLIAGQLKSSIMQYTSLIKSFQDAKISLDRLSEIMNRPNEDDNCRTEEVVLNKIHSIKFEKVRFAYENEKSFIIRHIDFQVCSGETIAIIGASGSGKTTLLKLLLKYHPPTAGRVLINESIDLADIHSSVWRNKCGVVMQEGFIFYDTIKSNICITDFDFDTERFYKAAKAANIYDWVESLPFKWETKIGRKGMTISTGQKQRILIARALYKRCDVLLCDEITSSLDAENEQMISDNIHGMFDSQIKVIITHRYNNLKHADKILVIDKGEIAEAGTHTSLMELGGRYYSFISKQIEFEDDISIASSK